MDDNEQLIYGKKETNIKLRNYFRVKLLAGNPQLFFLLDV